MDPQELEDSGALDSVWKTFVVRQRPQAKKGKILTLNVFENRQLRLSKVVKQ